MFGFEGDRLKDQQVQGPLDQIGGFGHTPRSFTAVDDHCIDWLACLLSLRTMLTVNSANAHTQKKDRAIDLRLFEHPFYSDCMTTSRSGAVIGFAGKRKRPPLFFARANELSCSKHDKIFPTPFCDGDNFLRRFVISDRYTRERIALGWTERISFLPEHGYHQRLSPQSGR